MANSTKHTKKRFLVTADYPGSSFRKGDIITDALVGKTYPDVFRELKWYEFLKLEDVPQYLIVTAETVNHHRCKGEVIKTGETHFWNGTDWSLNDKGFVDAYGGILLYPFEPITEEEYNKLKK